VALVPQAEASNPFAVVPLVPVQTSPAHTSVVTLQIESDTANVSRRFREFFM
jgi:hypothetical protein